LRKTLGVGWQSHASLILTPNPDGLGLQTTSPAIDHGVALASDYSTSINSVRRPSGVR